MRTFSGLDHLPNRADLGDMSLTHLKWESVTNLCLNQGGKDLQRGPAGKPKLGLSRGAGVGYPEPLHPPATLPFTVPTPYTPNASSVLPLLLSKATTS